MEPQRFLSGFLRDHCLGSLSIYCCLLSSIHFFFSLVSPLIIGNSRIHEAVSFILRLRLRSTDFWATCKHRFGIPFPRIISKAIHMHSKLSHDHLRTRHRSHTTILEPGGQRQKSLPFLDRARVSCHHPWNERRKLKSHMTISPEAVRNMGTWEWKARAIIRTRTKRANHALRSNGFSSSAIHAHDDGSTWDTYKHSKVRKIVIGSLVNRLVNRSWG